MGRASSPFWFTRQPVVVWMYHPVHYYRELEQRSPSNDPQH